MATGAPPATATAATGRMDRYLWLILLSAFLAWMLDSVALNVFNLVLTPSLRDLLGTAARGEIAGVGGLVVATKLFAWGVGGTLFGVLTDRLGRARIMLVTIVIYAGFTGLSALARTWPQLAVCQALAGFGIGGEWAAGAALLAESLPERWRPSLMIVMQLAYAVGFFFAAGVNLALGPFGWRWVFVGCAVPAVVALVLRLFVREPQRWVAVRASGRRSLGSLRRLLAPELRGATLGGLLSAMALMVGAFAATTFVPSWIGELTGGGPAAAVRAASYFAMLLNAGAVAGYLVLIWVVRVLGRRGCFFVYCLGSLVVAVVLFTRVADAGTLLLLAPVAGFFVLGGFGVFAVYLPELFPTEVRATGQGICFNLARVVTGFGTLATGFLVGRLGSYPAAGLVVSLAFTVGLLTIWIAPETRGRTLQDTDRAADRVAVDRVAVEP